MSKDTGPVWNAVASTALFTVIAGTAVAVSAYLLLLGGAHLFEAFGWLPGRWAQTHGSALVIGTAALAVPAVGAAMVWMFRNALSGERELDRSDGPG